MYPGEPLRTDIWRDNGSVSFHMTVFEPEALVLNHGRGELTSV